MQDKKELQITYLNNKIRSPCAFLSSFCKASGNFFAKRAYSKTPAENRTDCTLSDKNLSDTSDEIFWRWRKILSDKVLSDKVGRKLGQIHILWFCILYSFLLFFSNKTFKNPKISDLENLILNFREKPFRRNYWRQNLWVLLYIRNYGETSQQRTSQIRGVIDQAFRIIPFRG